MEHREERFVPCCKCGWLTADSDQDFCSWMLSHTQTSSSMDKAKGQPGHNCCLSMDYWSTVRWVWAAAQLLSQCLQKEQCYRLKWGGHSLWHASGVLMKVAGLINSCAQRQRLAALSSVQSAMGRSPALPDYTESSMKENILAGCVWSIDIFCSSVCILQGDLKWTHRSRQLNQICTMVKIFCCEPWSSFSAIIPQQCYYWYLLNSHLVWIGA